MHKFQISFHIYCTIVIFIRRLNGNKICTSITIHKRRKKSTVEREDFKKILPLLEIVNERAAQKRKGSFRDTYLTDLFNFNYPILIDIPIYINVNKGTRDNVKLFLGKFKLNPALKVHYYKLLSTNKNIIPTTSYDSNAVYMLGTTINDSIELRKCFKSICFRIFTGKDFTKILSDIEKVITHDDILIFDINKILPSDSKLSGYIVSINELKAVVGFTSVIIKSAINPDIIFNKMTNADIVSKADNSLLESYTKLGFDAFGDFAEIRKDSTISKGGSRKLSAEFIYYSWEKNKYVGFRGRFPDYNEFINHIKPSIMRSNYWINYGVKHLNCCLGCLALALISSTYSWDWKRYSIQHYLYTMEENL